MTDFEKEYIDDMLKAKEICDYLSYNNNDIYNPKFKILWDSLKVSVSIAEIVDFYIHKKDFTNMVESVTNVDNLAVFWKKPHKDVKIGDIIDDGKVVGIFTLTVWVDKDYNQ